MPKKAIVFLAEGFEEVEAVTPVDYLRRAGVDVTTAAVGASRTVKGAHGMEINADAAFAELAKKGGADAGFWDAVILPGGGGGSKNLAASKETGALVRAMAASGKLVAAICASPAVVLAPLGVLKGRKFTCYPGMEKEVSGAVWSSDPVVADGNIITSRGAGTAGAFALAVIGKLVSEAAGKKIAGQVVVPGETI
ncbi:MAG: DJ-1/PfpI family protein [Treponema sp.]|jgi:4-methyl-5(b-hydroxyethyl)-thiazole monophosphate biosynthesis|nr:DJ-1/PfpI family protein [Treponema sp.]